MWVPERSFRRRILIHSIYKLQVMCDMNPVLKTCALVSQPNMSREQNREKDVWPPGRPQVHVLPREQRSRASTSRLLHPEPSKAIASERTECEHGSIRAHKSRQ